MLTKPYLKTAYVSGTSGYNIWSNGYCEQWGRGTVPGSGWLHINLLKTYADTNYNVLVSPLSGTVYSQAPYITTIATYAILIDFESVSISCDILWRTSGYLADGQY